MSKKFRGITHIIAIVDKSGSMYSIRTDTIGGFNSYLDSLRDKENIKVTTTLFDTEFKILYVEQDIKDIPQLTEKEYAPYGSTALLDAVGHTLLEIKPNKEDRYLVVIVTDGEENSSHEYDMETIRSLIADKEKENWTFTYLGANQDVWTFAGGLSMAMGNVSGFDPKNIQASFAMCAMSTGTYLNSNSSRTADFYKD